MRILDADQIRRKLARLAVEILERHHGRERLFLVGVNNNGYETARLLRAGIEAEGYGLGVELRRVRLSPADPLHGGIAFEGEIGELDGEHVVLVDDVANTGRTAFYATAPLTTVLPASLEVAVLVDRKHKSWPVSCDYVGLTLATSLQEDIRVYYGDDWRVEVF